MICVKCKYWNELDMGSYFGKCENTGQIKTYYAKCLDFKEKVVKNEEPTLVDSSYLDAGAKHYVKRPFPIKAKQINFPFMVQSMEGIMYGKSGDYFVEGIEGELYLVDKAIFEKSYVEVNNDFRMKND